MEKEKPQTTKARKRRKSAPTKGERKAARRCSRASTADDKKKGKKAGKKSKETAKDAYDSGSNASSSRSRGPYIQVCDLVCAEHVFVKRDGFFFQ